jgi:hypothetical protein
MLIVGVAGHQGMLWFVTGQVNLGYPALRSGFRSERLGLQANRHLERPQRVHLRERGRATTGCQGERGDVAPRSAGNRVVIHRCPRAKQPASWQSVRS